MNIDYVVVCPLLHIAYICSLRRLERIQGKEDAERNQTSGNDPQSANPHQANVWFVSGILSPSKLKCPVMKKLHIYVVLAIIITTAVAGYFLSFKKTNELKYPSQAFEAKYEWQRQSDPASVEDRTATLTIAGDGSGRFRFEWSDRPSEYQLENFNTHERYAVMPEKREYHDFSRDADMPAVLEFYREEFLRKYAVESTGAQHVRKTRVDGYRIVGQNVGGIAVRVGEKRMNEYWFDQANKFLVQCEDTSESDTGKGPVSCTIAAALKSIKFAEQDPSFFQVPAGYAKR